MIDEAQCDRQRQGQGQSGVARVGYRHGGGGGADDARLAQRYARGGAPRGDARAARNSERGRGEGEIDRETCDPDECSSGMFTALSLGC